jgi:predicted DNA-binding mobile mystery protein A
LFLEMQLQVIYCDPMKVTFRRVLASVISRKIRKFPKPGEAPVPPGGWLRAIRLATGMPASYPAKKLGLTQQGFDALEKNEAAGAITLKSLKRAADAMECDVVYALVPRGGSIGTMILRQAVARARKAILPVAHSMRLESQGSKPGPKVRELARKLAAHPSRTLWNG